jgi:quinol monooxygenase YgiN
LPATRSTGSFAAMIEPSRVVTIHPYFRVKPGKLAEAKAKLPEFIAKTSQETGNLYYHFTSHDDVIFCREGYDGAEGLLQHLENVGATLAEFLTLVEVIRIEVHGAAAELEKLKGPLAGLKPEWFVFECGVQR